MESFEDGFIITLPEGKREVLWNDIMELHGYKIDLMTTDEICLDIVLAESVITIPESSENWAQLLEKIKEEFPLSDKEWDTNIIQPPFATNFTVLYKRDEH